MTKPTALKELLGTAQPCRTNPDEPKPEVKMPSAPKHLSFSAKAEWRRLAKVLEYMGLVTEWDRAGLALYCQAYGKWVEAEKALEEEGSIIHTPNGMQMPNPWVSISNKQAELLLRFSKEFGFTPASRQKVSVDKPQTDGDPMESYVKK